MFIQTVDAWRLRHARLIPILAVSFLLLSAPGGLAQRPEENATRVEVYRFYNPNNPTEPYIRQFLPEDYPAGDHYSLHEVDSGEPRRTTEHPDDTKGTTP